MSILTLIAIGISSIVVLVTLGKISRQLDKLFGLLKITNKNLSESKSKEDVTSSRIQSRLYELEKKNQKPERRCRLEGLKRNKHPRQRWYYDPDKAWWFHRHTKGIWPFKRNYYYVEVHRNGWCTKCGAKVPENLRNII